MSACASGGLRVFLAAFVACAILTGGPAAAEGVALTFDDLPALSLSDSTAYWTQTTRDLLAGLRRHHIRATGFVNEEKLEDDRVQRVGLLRQWLDAGMDLGDHTYSHLSLPNTPVDAYITDAIRGETVTRWPLKACGRTPRWFRHPYLETGKTLEDRRRFEAWLGAYGYRVAPVSMENSDWMFAYRYDEAVGQGDVLSARRIQQEYLASRLNADSVDQLAAILARDDLHPVTPTRP